MYHTFSTMTSSLLWHKVKIPFYKKSPFNPLQVTMSASPELRDEDRLEDAQEEAVLAGKRISPKEIQTVFQKALPSVDVAAARLADQKKTTGATASGAAIGLYGGPSTLATPEISRSSPPQSTKGTDPIYEAVSGLRKEVLESRGKMGEAVQLLIALATKCDGIAKAQAESVDSMKKEISTLNTTVLSLQTQQRAVEADTIKVKTYLKDLLRQTAVPSNQAAPPRAIPAEAQRDIDALDDPVPLQSTSTIASGAAERLMAELNKLEDGQIPDPFDVYMESIGAPSQTKGSAKGKSRSTSGYRSKRAI